MCATCWGDDAVHAERYQLKEPGRQAKRSTTTKATIVFRIPDPPNASYMFKLGQRCGETVCNMLGLRSDGMLFVVTRRELWYLNVEIKNLAWDFVYRFIIPTLRYQQSLLVCFHLETTQVDVPAVSLFRSAPTANATHRRAESRQLMQYTDTLRADS